MASHRGSKLTDAINQIARDMSAEFDRRVVEATAQYTAAVQWVGTPRSSTAAAAATARPTAEPLPKPLRNAAGHQNEAKNEAKNEVSSDESSTLVDDDDELPDWISSRDVHALKQLKGLLDLDILTRGEFEAQKAQVLRHVSRDYDHSRSSHPVLTINSYGARTYSKPAEPAVALPAPARRTPPLSRAASASSLPRARSGSVRKGNERKGKGLSVEVREEEARRSSGRQTFAPPATPSRSHPPSRGRQRSASSLRAASLSQQSAPNPYEGGTRQSDKATRQNFDKRQLRRDKAHSFVPAIAAWQRDNIDACAAFTLDAKVSCRQFLQVFVRKRPLFVREEESGEFDIISVPPSSSQSGSAAQQLVVHNCLTGADLKSLFVKNVALAGHGCFGDDATSEDVYEAMARPMVTRAVGGAISTIFSFGQTGSGKTFTCSAIEGMAAQQIFEEVHLLAAKGTALWVYFTFVEVYGNHVLDLLTPDCARVQLKDDNHRIAHIEGAAKQRVHNPPELIGLVEACKKRRKTESTFQNATSSRSHAMLQDLAGGGALTVLATVAPGSADTEHTLHTLHTVTAMCGIEQLTTETRQAVPELLGDDELAHLNAPANELPSKWDNDRIREWMATVNDGAFRDAAAVLPAHVSGQLLVRMDVTWFKQILCNASEKRANKLYALLRKAVASASKQKYEHVLKMGKLREDAKYTS
ncbi:P-loop containing nucleoside triphosphate hydrolase protein [Pavlovales sp. CCMP2436]|nr:P-loop containing nucleoside triphosphate hydrolase protein [Pavlovales sp. CCMP2436]